MMSAEVEYIRSFGKFWFLTTQLYVFGQKPGQEKHDATQIPHTSPVLKVELKKLFGPNMEYT